MYPNAVVYMLALKYLKRDYVKPEYVLLGHVDPEIFARRAKRVLLGSLFL